jgi:acylphosphatase
MVTREFNIEGENVVNVGMRSALLDKSMDYDVSVHASNLSDKIVRVIIDGDTDSIDEFMNAIRKEDVRIYKETPKNYSFSELHEYFGPEIDWNRYEIRFMSKQMYKGFKEANEGLSKIERTLKHNRNDEV